VQAGTIVTPLKFSMDKPSFFEFIISIVDVEMESSEVTKTLAGTWKLFNKDEKGELFWKDYLDFFSTREWMAQAHAEVQWWFPHGGLLDHIVVKSKSGEIAYQTIAQIAVLAIDDQLPAITHSDLRNRHNGNLMLLLEYFRENGGSETWDLEKIMKFYEKAIKSFPERDAAAKHTIKMMLFYNALSAKQRLRCLKIANRRGAREVPGQKAAGKRPVYENFIVLQVFMQALLWQLNEHKDGKCETCFPDRSKESHKELMRQYGEHFRKRKKQWKRKSPEWRKLRNASGNKGGSEDEDEDAINKAMFGEFEKRLDRLKDNSTESFKDVKRALCGLHTYSDLISEKVTDDATEKKRKEKFIKDRTYEEKKKGDGFIWWKTKANQEHRFHGYRLKGDDIETEGPYKYKVLRDVYLDLEARFNAIQLREADQTLRVKINNNDKKISLISPQDFKTSLLSVLSVSKAVVDNYYRKLLPGISFLSQERLPFRTLGWGQLHVAHSSPLYRLGTPIRFDSFQYELASKVQCTRLVEQMDAMCLEFVNTLHAKAVEKEDVRLKKELIQRAKDKELGESSDSSPQPKRDADVIQQKKVDETPKAATREDCSCHLQ